MRPSIQEPILYEEVNCVGTLNILEACKRLALKILSSVLPHPFTALTPRCPFSEEDPVEQPISPYAAHQEGRKLMCYTYAHLYDIPVTALRFFTVYGEKQRPEMAICKFTRLIWEGEEIPVFGNGTSKRDYTYISDILQGLIASIDKVSTYEIINLGESRTVELNYLISIIEEKLQKKSDHKKV